MPLTQPTRPYPVAGSPSPLADTTARHSPVFVRPPSTPWKNLFGVLTDFGYPTILPSTSSQSNEGGQANDSEVSGDV
jgi:hypothetical protein